MNRRFSHSFALPLVLAVLVGAGASAQSIESRPAVQAPLADESLLLDVIPYEGGFVAVGQRGHVLLSGDGHEWRQAQQVPTRTTLTRVTRYGQRLWAVGHDASILSSIDGGETWNEQHSDPEGNDLDPGAQGPLLDVLFVNPNLGFAIGAYGRFMTTEDGGINWNVQRMADRVTSEAIDWQAMAAEQGGYETLPDDFTMGDAGDPLAELDRGCYDFEECHLNDIIELDNKRLMIAAERGYGYRSEDRGETWEAFRFPYTGSMFGLVRQGECIVAFGLRGHIQRSCDFGDNWTDLDTGGEQTLLGGEVTDDGRVILVGSGATRVTLHPDGRMERDADRLGSDYAAVALDDGAQILVGENGVRHD